MRIKYFPDTDTLLIELSDAEVVETREISEDIYIDFSKHGDPVSITIEHAREKADLSEVTFSPLADLKAAP